MSSVRFRQLGAIVELQLFSTNEAYRGELIRSVTFESEETPLAGDFQFNLTTVTVDGELPIADYESTAVTTELEEPAAVPATKDEAARVYLTIAPGEYSGKFVVYTNAAQYTFSLSKAMTFDRAVIKGLPADLAEATRGTDINFKDAEVKRICLANWNTDDNATEFSYQEAAAVTDLGRAFDNNNSIFSFDELQYFTGLKSIRNSAFSHCSKLTSIKIPAGVTAIGDYAFNYCISLTNITLPDGVTQIGEAAFELCSSLESITLPNTLTTILSLAFSDCASLTSIHIPETVSFIGAVPFLRCSSLSAFSGKYATADHRCLIQDGTLLAFAPAGLTEYTIPDGVTWIGDGTFRDCSSLTSVIIPAGVTDIYGSAFMGCSSLASVYCKPTAPPTLYSRDVFTETSSSMKIYVPVESVEEYRNAEGWSEYADRIFADIKEDDPIRFADQNVKDICVARWSTDTDNTELSYKEAAAVTELAGAFTGNRDIASFNELQYFTGLQSIGSNAFQYCENLTSIKIPEGVTTIGEFAFRGCDKLTNITLPNGVTEIGASAFNSCSSLTNITLPNTLTTIGRSAFLSCSSLMSIHIPETVSSIGVEAFARCSSLSAFSGKYATADNLCLIQGSTLLASAPAAITEYTIPEGVTQIEPKAFYGCNKLTTIKISEGVTEIREEAFFLCVELTSINLPNTLTSIRGYAFHGCEGLEHITIPAEVMEIGERAFFSCGNLASVYCKPTAPPTLGSEVFSWTSSSMKIYVPVESVEEYRNAQGWSDYADRIVADMNEPIKFADQNVKQICVARWNTDEDSSNLSYKEAAAVTNLGEVFSENEAITSFDELQYFTGLKSIGRNAFYGCASLTSINIPAGVTTIGGSAFFSCSSLMGITIPERVMEIGDQAFFGSKLTSIYCKPTDPPTLGREVFSRISSVMTIYVPADSVDAYKRAENWSSWASRIFADNN